MSDGNNQKPCICAAQFDDVSEIVSTEFGIILNELSRRVAVMAEISNTRNLVMLDEVISSVLPVLKDALRVFISVKGIMEVVRRDSDGMAKPGMDSGK